MNKKSMNKVTRLILGSSLLAISALCFSADSSGTEQHATEQYRYSDGPQNDNDWSDTPWGQKPPPVNRGNDSNTMPWSGDSPIGIGDSNPAWKTGNSLWRDWDTNKWGGNGMPWSGNKKSSMPWGGKNNSSMPWGGGNNMMPWSKDKKQNKNYNYRAYTNPYPAAYGNPYQGGYANPYPGAYGNPYQTRGYGNRPY